MREEWKIIPNTNHLYEASSLGNIRRVVGYVRNNVDGGKRKVGGKNLSQKTKSNGYKEVQLFIRPQQGKMKYVHRLVSETFIGKIPDGYHVNHLDGNKANNAVYNLEIVSPSENAKHAYLTGLNKPPRQFGETHSHAKHTDEDVVYMRRLYAEGKYPREIAEIVGSKKSTVCNIVYRRSWRHI